MLLKTRLFGEIEVEEKEVINFTKPILGFDDCRQYVLVEKEAAFPVFWLQSVDKPDVAFPVVSPFSVNEEYAIKIRPHDLSDIQAKNTLDILVLTILVVPDTITSLRTNLRAPIIYNPVDKVAKQLILNDDKYPIQHYILDQES
ncbi:MAG: flagellar assembly protein FliW [Candidatus Scalindua sp.]|jgi:flagellar assembly factor FliW|nr:flagellar assembly protein FliW [Candidatus Scalindua sp.]MBT7592982.1 flagellar assembly protein FliW [Candidatus Scalindua sp.]